MLSIYSWEIEYYYGRSNENSDITKYPVLTVLYCKVIKLVGCSFSRDHTAWSDSTQLNPTGCINSELVQTDETDRKLDDLSRVEF